MVNVKFGTYIYRAHPNKSPLKFWEKMERGRIQGLSNFFWVPPIISETYKATNFDFCTHILSIDGNKSLLQISGKIAGCVVRTLKTFQGTHILRASRVFFAIAQLSCYVTFDYLLALFTHTSYIAFLLWRWKLFFERPENQVADFS